jgi:hypothetical protein
MSLLTREIARHPALGRAFLAVPALEASFGSLLRLSRAHSNGAARGCERSLTLIAPLTTDVQ